MALNTELLRSSFDAIVEREAMITPRFYEILFSRYPQVKPLFGKNATAAQQEMLQSALVSVIDNLENSTWLSTTLMAMGKKHVDYGVTEEMFDWVGDALLTTLSEILQQGWTPEVAHAWQEAYGAIRGLMLSGMADATVSA